MIGPSSIFLGGFETSDFTVDSDLNGQPTLSVNHTRAVGGIAVSGKNIFLRRIRVINFGNARNTSGTVNKCYAISAAWATTTSPAGNLPYNCLIEDCEVSSPQGQVSQPVICLHVGTDGSNSAYLHTGCVIRNCWVDLGSGVDFTKDYRAICACGGKGTIVEGNRVYNCTSAGPHNDSAEVALPTTDLVVRENYFYNVKYGINLSATGGALGRVVIENNVIELTQSVTGPTGLSLLSSAGSSPVFNQVVARGNCIRPADGVSPSASTVGITLSRISQAVIESNVISVSDANQAVTHANCGSVKCFDSQSPQGVILRGYDSASAVHDAELTTDVEDALLNL